MVKPENAMNASTIPNYGQELRHAHAVASRMLKDYEDGNLGALKAARLAKKAWGYAVENIGLE